MRALCTHVSHYGRVDALGLQWVDVRGVTGYAMGHRTFAILAAIPRWGVIIIRNMEIVVIADSPVLALWLVVASMFPALIFPLLLSGARELRLWIA
ncbi:hypothetical protein EDD15DRAFT_2330365, partial [Pisolithus albus]